MDSGDAGCRVVTDADTGDDPPVWNLIDSVDENPALRGKYGRASSHWP